jgi:hypothetical protein
MTAEFGGHYDNAPALEAATRLFRDGHVDEAVSDAQRLYDHIRGEFSRT